jgi:hypothetical protein
MGETSGIYVLSPAHCGLSFRIPIARRGKLQANPEWTAAMLRELPPDTRVNQVLVTGCSR